MEKELDTILATMQVTKSNVKGRHWMVTGHEYEALHKMFDKIYKVLDDGTDKVGEIFRQLRIQSGRREINHADMGHGSKNTR